MRPYDPGSGSLVPHKHRPGRHDVWPASMETTGSGRPARCTSRTAERIATSRLGARRSNSRYGTPFRNTRVASSQPASKSASSSSPSGSVAPERTSTKLWMSPFVLTDTPLTERSSSAPRAEVTKTLLPPDSCGRFLPDSRTLRVDSFLGSFLSGATMRLGVETYRFFPTWSSTPRHLQSWTHLYNSSQTTIS